MIIIWVITTCYNHHQLSIQDQFLHNDTSIPAARGEGICDVLCMFCFRASQKGGVSKMASAAAIHEQLREQLELLPGVEMW